MATAAELLPQVVNGAGFRHSETFAKLAEALGKAQIKFTKLTKDTSNPYYNSKYATLDAIIEATRPALAENGLVVLQSPRTESRTVIITTLLAHISGEWIADDLTLPGEMKGKDGVPRFDAQSVGAAITYGRRYAYQSFVGIAAEEDDDGNALVRAPERKAAPVRFERPSPPVTETSGLNAAGRAAQHRTEATQNMGFVTEAQGKRFWAMAKGAGRTEKEIREYFGANGFENTGEMPRKDYEKHCEWAQNNLGV